MRQTSIQKEKISRAGEEFPADGYFFFAGGGEAGFGAFACFAGAVSDGFAGLGADSGAFDCFVVAVSGEFAVLGVDSGSLTGFSDVSGAFAARTGVASGAFCVAGGTGSFLGGAGGGVL